MPAFRGRSDAYYKNKRNLAKATFNPLPYTPKLRGYAPNFKRYSIRGPMKKRNYKPSTGGGLKSTSSKLIKNANGSLTNSDKFYSHRAEAMVRTMKKVGVPQIYSLNNGARYNGAFGFQNIWSLSLLNQSQLSTILHTVQKQSGLVNTYGIVYPQAYCLESVIGNFNIANCSTVAVELEIYDVVPKRDVYTKMQFGTNYPAVPYETTGTPDEMWKKGSLWSNGENVTGTTPYPAESLGAKPTDIQLWNDYWKITGKKRVMLSAGGVHRHTINVKVNKLIDTSLINMEAGDSAAHGTYVTQLRGFTKNIMVVAKGMPVSDSENAAVVTSCDTHLDVVLDYRYKYTYVQNNNSYVQNTDLLTSPAAAQAVTTFNSQVVTVSTAV